MIAMITYESAVHHHSDHPHDLHRGLPTSDVLKTRQSNLGMKEPKFKNVDKFLFLLTREEILS